MRTHALWLALTLSWVAPAVAEPPPVDVQHFHPHADQRGWFATQSADTLELWQPAFAAWFTYARDPLLFEYADGTFDRVVGDLASLNLQAAIGFRYADLAVDVPLHLRVAGDGFSDWSGSFGSTALGDIRVVPKVRFLDPEVQGILEDPSTIQAVNAGDIGSLTANPKFMKLLENPTIQDITKKMAE